MSLSLSYDPDGLPPRMVQALDEIVSNLQQWGNKFEASWPGAFSCVQPRCTYSLDSEQTITNNLATAVSWPAAGQNYDPADIVMNAIHYDNGANYGRGHKFLKAAGTKLTPPLGGMYLCIGGATFAANATGRREVYFRQWNGSTSWILGDNFQLVVAAGVDSSVMTANIVVFRDINTTTTEEAIELEVYQNSGGNLNLRAGFMETYIQMIKLS